MIYGDDVEEGEMDWESAARQAVTLLLQSAEWDVDQKCVVLPDEEHGKFPTYIENIDALRIALLEKFRELWYACAPFEGGEAVFRSDCVEDEVIEKELEPYKKKISSLGWRL